MDCNVFRQRLAEAFPEYHFDTVPAGAGWVRIFVRYRGVQLGRISLEPVAGGYRVNTVKFYKPEGATYAPEDAFFYLFNHWYTHGVVPQVDFEALVAEAKRVKREKIEARKKWREQNPKFKVVRDAAGKMHLKEKPRHRLQTGWMGEFRKLVDEVCYES